MTRMYSSNQDTSKNSVATIAQNPIISTVGAGSSTAKITTGFHKSNAASLLVLLILVFNLLTGCVAVQPFPSAARPGDTITLAVGSPDHLDKSSITVTYTPDSTGIPQDITTNLRSIIKIYPDKLSKVWFDSAAASLPPVSGHSPWLYVLVIDLPSGLSEGTGVINVTAPATYPLFSQYETDIIVEILPGTGSSNTLDYYGGAPTPTPGDLSFLEPLPHYQIKPDFDPATWASPPRYAAAEISVSGTFPSNLTDSNINYALKIVADDMPTSSIQNQKQVSWSRDGGNITINIFSPNGGLYYYETYISLAFKQTTVDFMAMPSVSIKYYDIDGTEVSGPPLTIRKCNVDTGCV